MVTNNGDGTFTYDPNGAFISLKAGATAIDKFLYSVTDGSGVSSTAMVTVTIIGQNEVPVITTGSQSAILIEDAQGHMIGNESGSGSIAFTDADVGDVHAASFVAQGSDYVGLLTLDTSQHDNGEPETGGTIGWKFAVPDSAVEHLAAGETLTQKYTVTIDDGNGGRALETITISILGTNDTPVITGETSPNVAIKVDDDGHNPVVASGLVAFGDVDLTDRHVVSVQSHEGDGRPYYGTLDVAMIADSTGSTLGTVQWTYRISGQGPDLREGEKLVQLYDIAIDDGRGGKAIQTITVTLVGEERQQNDQRPPFITVPSDFKFDFPKYREFELPVWNGPLQAPVGGLSYVTFVAYSGWVPHGDNVNTSSTDTLEDDGGYCPVPAPFTPWDHSQNSSHFSPDDIRHQLQWLNQNSFGGLPPKPSAGTGVPDHRGDATGRIPVEHLDAQPDKTSGGAPHAKRSEAAPQRAVSPVATAIAAAKAVDMRQELATVGAFLAPMMLVQGARLGLRQARKPDDERSLGVSFTSAGGVKSVVFKLNYDAESLVVTGVKPGADLPKTARIALSCVPNGDTSTACIVVTSDEELIGGTVDLASLSVRYLRYVSDEAVRLVSVDVNGDGVDGADPVRISIKASSLDDDMRRQAAVADFQNLPGHQAHAGDAAESAGRVTISMTSLETDAVNPPVMLDESESVYLPIRIAVSEFAHDQPAVRRPIFAPDRVSNLRPHRPADETATGEVRIPAAILAQNGAAPPRISIV